jgi:hypothetical protein
LQKKTYLQSIYCALGAAAAGLCVVTTGYANDGSYCHDMPINEAILNEGRNCLNRGSYIERADRREFSVDDGMFRYRSTHKPDDQFRNISIFKIDHLPLETPEQQLDAEGIASKLERAQHFQSAHRLYMRILKQREGDGASNNLLIKDLESAGRTAILAASKWPLPRPSQNDWDDGPEYTRTSEDNRLLGRSFIRRVIKNASDTSLLTSAESLYSRAISQQRKLPKSDGQLISDLLILAALEEKRSEINQAKTTYLEAVQRDKDTTKYLAAFAYKHKDLELARRYESDFLREATKLDSASTSVLLSLYLADKRKEDALQLFNKTMTSSVYVPADILIPMFDIVPTTEVDKLTTYIANVWLVKSDLDPSFVSVIIAMKKHGWSKSIDSLCQLGVYRFPIFNQPLLLIAECYRQTDNPNGALSVFRTILKSVQTERAASPEAIKALSEMVNALNSDDLKGSQESQSLLAAISTELNFQTGAIRSRQCLGMAEKLNETAYELERNGHDKMAQKLYLQALEIKQLNLPKDDPETASQMLDVARISTALKEYPLAQSSYEKAVLSLRKSSFSMAKLKQALEGYGQLLNQMQQTKKAEQIYSEARELAKRI